MDQGKRTLNLIFILSCFLALSTLSAYAGGNSNNSAPTATTEKSKKESVPKSTSEPSTTSQPQTNSNGKSSQTQPPVAKEKPVEAKPTEVRSPSAVRQTPEVKQTSEERVTKTEKPTKEAKATKESKVVEKDQVKKSEVEKQKSKTDIKRNGKSEAKSKSKPDKVGEKSETKIKLTGPGKTEPGAPIIPTQKVEQNPSQSPVIQIVKPSPTSSARSEPLSANFAYIEKSEGNKATLVVSGPKIGTKIKITITSQPAPK